jgi:hypothetical protein
MVLAPADRECRVHFEDGTQITLARGTQGRINALSYRRGATFALNHGHVDLAVIHRLSARWDVAAGPFDVRVTGTRFAVDWTPSPEHFTLRVSEGEVHVSGCRQAPDTSVRAGQGLEGDASHRCTNIEPPAGPDPVARIETPVPPRADPTPTVVRNERRRPSAGGRLAMRNPESLGKAERPNPPAAEPSLSQLTERDWSASSGLAPEIKLGPRRLAVGSDGRLTGPEPGSLIAIGGLGTRFSIPSKAVGSNIRTVNGELNGIVETPWTFSSSTTTLGRNLYLQDGALCTRGRIPALTCDDEKIPIARCDWKTNWGALIQWQPRNGEAWGSQASSSVALDYHGNAVGYRLVAHRQGDPDDVYYCVDSYRSGQRVTPSHFNLHCWKGGGTHLADFSKVDYFSLQVSSLETAQRFRFCVSSIDLR